MLDGLLSFAAFAAADTLATGKPPERSGNDHPLVAPYGLFRASDGDVAIAPANDGIYARLLKALDLEHLAADPRFTTNALRMTNREAINALVNGRIGRATRAHWIEHLNRAGVPCGPVMSYPEILADPQVAARDMVMESSAPDRRTIRMTGFPLKFLAGPSRLRRPAPRLGEHTREILVELGLSARVPDESER
jgi:crotonobetainyl-CoA:carnitine CoA-transferase CaiB-like acyl-CoA transferase